MEKDQQPVSREGLRTPAPAWHLASRLPYPKPRSDVQRQGSARSPVGREPQGDGASIVVGGRENRPQGEARQVDRNSREQGRRNGQSRTSRDFRVLESRMRSKDSRPVRRGL